MALAHRPGPPVAADHPDGMDQSVSYGLQFAEVYDRIFPADAGSLRAAAFLHRLGGRSDATYVELGVGTGRVALPLATLGGRVTGVDTSRPLLALAARGAADRRLSLDLREDDIRRWRGGSEDVGRDVDVVYCICATVSMLACRDEQAAVLANAAATVRPGGAVVVETHNPSHIRALHGSEVEVTFVTDVPGIPGGLESRSRLLPGQDHWSVSHTWHDGTEGRSATEFSLLTTPDQLDGLAARAGLVPESLTADWSGTPYDADARLYVRVYRAGRTEPADPSVPADGPGPA